MSSEECWASFQSEVRARDMATTSRSRQADADLVNIIEDTKKAILN